MWHPKLAVLAQSSIEAGAVACQAGNQEKVQYTYLEAHPGIFFTPIAIETSGCTSLGPHSLIFLIQVS